MHLESEHPQQHLDAIATKCEGYLPRDLDQLIERAVHAASTRLLQEKIQNSRTTLEESSNSYLRLEDFEKALSGFTPSALKDIQLFKAEVSWESIGGMYEVRQMLKETFEWPTKHAKLFKSCPLRLRSG